MELFQTLYNRGYIIEIHIIGININVSRLGVHYRFENGSRIGAPERMVSMEVHDRNYHALPANLLALGKACGLLVSKLVLYSRDGNDKLNVVYETEHPCNFQELVTTLAFIRNRPFSNDEQADFKSKMEDVRTMIDARGGDSQKFLRDIEVFK
ncbi:zeta toxin family protein [Dawidia soli]|uniref:Zeta toxin family protein n=1 Tax=Dawidia soli TaxID=2782352 RepID=A0AAP2D5I9_9BACT|nr:zeta toxin family protein [Dawidia soli]MBT1685439.1 zeta toxin family protein [Dawidia soli]